MNAIDFEGLVYQGYYLKRALTIQPSHVAAFEFEVTKVLSHGPWSVSYDSKDVKYIRISLAELEEIKKTQIKLGLEEGISFVDNDTLKLIEKMDKEMKTITNIEDVQRPAFTEGVKFDAGKPKLSLLTMESLAGEARAFEYGMLKYQKNNYKNGMDWSRVLDASMRHITAFSGGEDNDPESSLNHLFHAKACLAMLIYYYENKVGRDDR